MSTNEFKRSRTLAVIILLLLLIAPTICGQDIPIKPQNDRRAVFTAKESIDKVDVKRRVKNDLKREYKIFEITAYDLSVASCGKLPTSRGYGITRSGKSLKGKSWKVRAIAVDPKVIKMGSKVRITFTGWRSKYNGVFTAVDSGSEIKGNKLDLFLGEGSYSECIKFGRVKAKIEILGGN
jgi:3D (Asp-Asp-Asp) domain-containing protein